MWAREMDLDPIATIGSNRVYLLVEWPLPWPKDFSTLDKFADLAPALIAQGGRLQGLVRSNDADLYRVAIYWSHSAFSGYRCTEATVPAGEVVQTGLRLLDDLAT